MKNLSKIVGVRAKIVEDVKDVNGKGTKLAF